MVTLSAVTDWESETRLLPTSKVNHEPQLLMIESDWAQGERDTIWRVGAQRCGCREEQT